jgi:hypothetical protein
VLIGVKGALGGAQKDIKSIQKREKSAQKRNKEKREGKGGQRVVED